MPSEKKGHGNLAIHGHGHKMVRPSDSASRKSGKVAGVLSKPAKSKPAEPQEENEAAVMHSEEETVYVPYDRPDYTRHENGDTTQTETITTEEEKHTQNGEHTKDMKKEKREYKKSNVTPLNFNVREFNTNITEFIRTLEDPSYSHIDSEYPVKELVSVVGLVSKSVNDYTSHSSDTQKQLEDLRETMKTIKENLHFSISRQPLDLRADEEHQTQEERELHVRLLQLNASLAQANADVTEAIRLATEAEQAAVKANIAAERARNEAHRIKEEAEKKAKAEQKRKEDEARQAEEQKRRKEEEERKVQEEKQRIENEWKRMEALQSEKSAQVYEAWPPVEYDHVNEQGEKEITCIARGHPGSFDGRNVICKVANEKEPLVTYQPNEELISNIVNLSSANEEETLKKPIFVAIPHVMSRSSAQSREPVVKALVDGEWKDLPTKDVTFESHKDTKFAQVEVHHLTTMIVMSRFKRDYLTLTPNKSHKVTSSVDQRITFNFEKDTFGNFEHFLLQVQPIDSGTIQEFRARQPNGKSLLTCSPVVYTQWQCISFAKPVDVTLSCPPNPAKAKKMALARKLKEDKMKNPPKKPPTIDEQEKEKEREKERKRMQEFMEADNEPVKVTKWYMGEYGHSDDDEIDSLHLVYMQGGKWVFDPDMVIKQVKVDVLFFRLKVPVERFMVLRTRTNLDEDSVVSMATALNEFLGKRFVEMIVRQKSDNPFEVALQVTPVSRLEAVVKQLAQKGFESGPAPSHVICLHEGDSVEVGFSGNIECVDRDIPEQLIYKTNIPTVAYFTVKEENRFRQKEQDDYTGLIHLTRRFAVTTVKNKRVQGQGQSQILNQGQGEENQLHSQKEWKMEKLCTIQINIPKYHVEVNTEPKKAPISFTDTSGPVDHDLLMNLAMSLGNEWKKLAHYLGVHRARVQAIMRNVTVGERSDREAKYDMLITWLKGATKSLDKVSVLSTALMHSDRYDLAEIVQERGRDFAELRGNRLTSAK